METKTDKTYTATDLAFYPTAHADEAADMASELIANDRSRWSDIDHAASAIAAYTASRYDKVGANDTASREAIAEALRASKHLQSRKAEAAWKAGRR